MNRTIQIAPVRRTVVVDATPVEAFEFFTSRIDSWWPKEVTVGHVRAWQPGERFIVGWEISGDWKPEPRTEFSSEVEVRFVTDGAARTRVELEHRGFEKMEKGAEAMRDGVDRGWPGILEKYVAAMARGLRRVS